MKSFEKNSHREKSRKRMRLPNGFGRITKIKGRARNPYRAMVTVGKDEYGKPIGKLLKPRAYFPTYNDAYVALLEYNRDPYDVRYNPTVEEVYEKWVKDRYGTAPERVSIHWKYLAIVKDMPFRDVRIRHIKLSLDEGYIVKYGKKSYPSENSKKVIKSIWNMLFDYGIEYGLTDRNYARDYRTTKPQIEHEHHKIFTDDEIALLQENIIDPICKAVYIQCYTGLRPRELITVKVSDIDLDAKTIIGGMKTKAGKNRIIPIHPKIENIIADAVATSPSGYLISGTRGKFIGRSINYDYLRQEFKKMLIAYSFDEGHKLHDGRKTFVTLAKRWDVDEYAIKRIIGHSVKDDITESVYTERSTEWLYKELIKIK